MQHADERDEREADHERGGRRGSALGVPHRILAREDPRSAREPCRRAAQDVRERRHELGREERDSEEDQHCARPWPGAAASWRGLAEQAVGEQREAREAEQRRADGPVARETSGRQRRTLANGSDRRHARRTASGPQAGDDGDENADDQRDDDRPCLQQQAAVGQREPDLVEEPEEAFREAQAEQDADDRGEQADDERLDQHGPHDLAPGRADRAQRRELAGPLRNGDRQRVRDHERADEQRDAAEGEQEALEEAEEARLARILVGLTFSGAHLGAGRQDGLNRRDELRLGRALGRSGTDLVEPPVLVEQLLRGGQVERGQRRPADVALGGEVEEPDTSSCCVGPSPARR